MVKWENKQLKQMIRQVKNGFLPQSLLFIGPEGTGKFSTLVELIGEINNLSEREKELVREGALADLVLLQVKDIQAGKFKYCEKGKSDRDMASGKIKKEILDCVVKKIILKNFQFPKKILIIRDANKLTLQASNSLLKLIEEPYDDLLIFLLVNNENEILSTIRSRCQRIYFYFLSDTSLQERIKEEFPELKSDQLQKVVELSYGRIELARRYALKPEELNEAIAWRDEFRKALRKGNVERFALVDKLVDKEVDLLWVLNEWVWYLKNFLEENIKAGASKAVLAKVYDILDKLLDLRWVIKTTNVNKRFQLENFFVQI